MLVAVDAAVVVISGFCPPAKVILPAVQIVRLDEVTANVPPELPMATLPDVVARDVPRVEERVVNAPVDGVPAPIVVPLIDPPEIETLDELKLLAVTAPAIVTVSSAEPMLIVSALLLLVPILIVFPEVPV